MKVNNYNKHIKIFSNGSIVFCYRINDDSSFFIQLEKDLNKSELYKKPELNNLTDLKQKYANYKPKYIYN